MVTTIQISRKLQDELTKKKLFDRETYEEIIWDLIEDSMDLSDLTKKELENARLEIKSGNSISMSELKKMI